MPHPFVPRRPARVVLAAAAGALALAAAAGAHDQHAAPAVTGNSAPAGAYTLDPSHASLVFRVNHLGLSSYAGRFSTFDATLDFDPEDPASMSVTAEIDVSSLAIPTPPEGFRDELLGAAWLDAGAHPVITFTSTDVELTGETTAKVTGDLSFHGVTRPITLDVTFNGGYAGFPPVENHPHIGFAAHGSLMRSDFGVSNGVPPEGSVVGVGDQVEIRIDAEFVGPENAPENAPGGEDG